MACWVVALLALAGCDTVWRIDHLADGPRTPFVQAVWNADSVYQNPYTSFSVDLGAQQLGDLDVVAICWATTPGIEAVTDTSGNTYHLAVPPAQMGSTGQAIYYAESIAAATANTVTVTFNSSGQAHKPDLRVAEYALMQSAGALDASSSGDGLQSLDMDSGELQTTSANDLLVAASCVTDHTDPLPGFDQRALTAPNGNMLADAIAPAPGAFRATGTQSGGLSGSWVLQLVAFKAAGQR
jgi:hypothetical protein